MVGRKFSKETKMAACKRAESGMEAKASICRQLAISASLLDTWLEQYRTKGENSFEGARWRHAISDPETRVHELEAALGRAHMEIEFMKECLGKLRRPPS